MPFEDVVAIGRELLITAIVLSLPTVLISLAIGIVISIFQTVTSIQEQTLTFAPRIVAVALVLIVTLPWTINVMIAFTQRMFMRIAEVGP